MTENTIKYCTTFEDGTMITPYLATAFAEGFCEGENATAKNKFAAWSYIIGTGLYEYLQGFYGRKVEEFIECGYITEEGELTDLIIEQLNM
jgi:hypothetical protein